MEYIIVPIIALMASLLTFFSGFGLGTILTPFFVIFFPVEIAIALTAIVHFLNNIFKALLIGSRINYGIALKFGLPAVAGAFIGARLLGTMSSEIILTSYYLGDQLFRITILKLMIGILMIVFSQLELVPKLKQLQFQKKYLIPGGILSGFFGGLSGHQGALRSAFLIKFDLSKEVFIATGIAIALAIDTARISIYLNDFLVGGASDNWQLLTVTIGGAFIGAVGGKWLLQKITIAFIQWIIGIFVAIIGILLAAGIL